MISIKRFLLSALIVACLAAPADAQITLTGAGQGALGGGGGSYTGPMDLVAAQFYAGLRAGSSAIAAAGTAAIVNVRRQSDSHTCDFLPASNGNLGLTGNCSTGAENGTLWSSWPGVDATASCTISGTAVSCSGTSGTIAVNDPVTGAGITNPCIVTVTNGSTTATAIIPGTASTGCGNVAVAETVTFANAMFIKTWNDQTGNGHTFTQATANLQGQLLPDCGNSLPCALSNGTYTYPSVAINSTAQPYSLYGVGKRPVASGSLNQDLISNNTHLGFQNAVNQAYGKLITSIAATANDGAWHVLATVANGASPNSVLNVDGSSTTGSYGTNATGTGLFLWNTAFVGYWVETLFSTGGFTGTDMTNLNNNASAYGGY